MWILIILMTMGASDGVTSQQIIMPSSEACISAQNYLSNDRHVTTYCLNTETGAVSIFLARSHK